MQSTFVRSLLFPWLLALLLVILGPIPVTHAATVNLNVDRVDDPAVTAAGVGAAMCSTAANDCSLRGAILMANAAVSDVFVINVATGTYTLTLTGANEDGNLKGDLDITRDVTIAGAGASATVIDGNNLDRVFDIRSGNVTISGVTIKGGQAPHGPPGSTVPGFPPTPGGSGENGGGIRNTSVLTLTNSVITANHAGAGGAGATDFAAGYASVGGPGGAGGGAYNTGALTVINTTIGSNGAGNGGAGAFGSGTTPAYPGASGGSGGDGGGIYNSGTLTVTGTILQSNHAGGGGNGGNGGSGIVGLWPGGYGGNGGNGGNGGGVYNVGLSSLAGAAVAGNATGNGGQGGLGGMGSMGMGMSPGMPGGSGGNGGTGGNGTAIYNAGKSTMSNSTVSGNTAGSGTTGGNGGSGGLGITAPGGPGGNGGNGGNGGSGGIYNGVFTTATITITSATITANNTGTGGTAGSGGSGGPGTPPGGSGSAGTTGSVGTGGGVAPYSGTLSLKNTILANNTTPAGGLGPDCNGTLDSQGYNLIRTLTNCTAGGIATGNITGQDPLLDALADNGGGTLTHALQAASPARDAGDPAGCQDAAGNLLLVDQRGWARTVGRCDIGAFEWQRNVLLPLLRR